MEDEKRNHEHYSDPTSYKALKSFERNMDEYAKVHKLVHMIRDICALSGFEIEGRIVLVDQKTGRVWR